MAQIVVFNDTGAAIAAAAVITLDGVNKVPPVKYVNSGVIVNLFDGNTISGPAATPTVLASTAAAPSSGSYAYRASDTTIKLGVPLKQSQFLVLDVELEGGYVRT